jgi:hypothetical protein
MARTMLLAMNDWKSIIVALGGTGAVSDALEQWPSTVSGWQTRGIPAGHWAAVVALASDLGRTEITLEVLARLAARKLEETRT